MRWAQSAQGISRHWELTYQGEAKRVKQARNQPAEQPRGPFAAQKSPEQLLDEYEHAVPSPGIR